MFNSIDEIKAANEAAGLHFFEADTMAFFRSRVSASVYPTGDGAFFVTSERQDDNAPRLYTVRYAAGDGHTHTLDPFNGLSRRSAHGHARLLAQIADAEFDGRGVDAMKAVKLGDAK